MRHAIPRASLGFRGCYLDLVLQLLQVAHPAMLLQLLELRTQPIRQGSSTACIQGLRKPQHSA